MSEKKSAVGWIMEMATIIGVFLVCFSFLHSQIQSLENKMDQRLVAMDKRIASQEARTDRLYEMFIDLLKEQKKIN